MSLSQIILFFSSLSEQKVNNYLFRENFLVTNNITRN